MVAVLSLGEVGARLCVMDIPSFDIYRIILQMHYYPCALSATINRPAVFSSPPVLLQHAILQLHSGIPIVQPPSRGLGCIFVRFGPAPSCTSVSLSVGTLSLGLRGFFSGLMYILLDIVLLSDKFRSDLDILGWLIL